MSRELVSINIAELLMQLPLRNTEHGQRLTADIVRRLQQMPQLPAPKASATIPNLRIDLAALSNDATDGEIAAAVVDGVHQALSRALASVTEGVQVPEAHGRSATDVATGGQPAPPAAATPPSPTPTKPIRPNTTAGGRRGRNR